MREPLPETLAVVGSLLWTMGLRVSAVLLIVAVADYAYQKYDFEKGLKMSLLRDQAGKQAVRRRPADQGTGPAACSARCPKSA